MACLPPAPEDSTRGDLGMNGSYLVFRQLSQDVTSFWRYCDAADATARRRVERRGADAARREDGGTMAGRCAAREVAGEGRPARSATRTISCITREGDAHGLKCPIGAHIRRTNPRDSLEPDPGSDRSIEVGKRHRVIRRGRAYGAPVASSMDAADVLAAGDSAR